MSDPFQLSRRRLLKVSSALPLVSVPMLSHASSAPTVIRFGVSNAGVGNPPRVATSWLSLAQHRRYLEEELKADGIKVEWIFFKGQGPAVNEALTNDQLDVSTLGDLPSIVGRSVGIKARLVMVTSRGTNTYVGVPPNSDVKGVRDLRGKRIAFHKGTATQLSANRILEQHGLNEKDVRIVNLEPAASLAAFQSGDLDALFYSYNLLPHADKGLAKIVYSTREYPQLTGAGHILVADRFAQQSPQLTQRIVTALVRAAHYASKPENRDEVLNLWASSGPVKVPQWEYDLNGRPLTEKLSPLFDPFVRSLNRRNVEDAYRYKLIRRKFDVDAWIDSRYVDTAVKQLGLQSFWPSLDAKGNA
jgi:sulfonate transport system substrate-binding protein